MDVTCPTCHRSAVPGDRFCAGCGAPISTAPAPGTTDDFHPLPLSVPGADSGVSSSAAGCS